MPKFIEAKEIIRTALESQAVQSIVADVVHRGDHFEYERHGAKTRLVHRPDPFAKKADSEIIGAYCVARLNNEFELVEVMGRDDIDGARKQSKSGNSGPWANWYGEMARKCVIKRAAKYWPRTERLQQIIDQDNETEAVAPPARRCTEEEVNEILELVDAASRDLDKLCRYFGIELIHDINLDQYTQAKAMLEKAVERGATA